jgi:hypothetical protein
LAWRGSLYDGIQMRNIFVFGSNLKGVHGAGAALFAFRNHGAVYGQGSGLQGNSYGIPTKDRKIKTLPLTEIEKHVNVFLEFAEKNKDLTFDLTAIGCGLAGYHPQEIAPMFKKSPDNVRLPKEFQEVLGGK